MSKDGAKDLVINYIEEVWNKGDLNALDDLIGQSYTYHLGGQPPRDKAAMRQFLEAVHVAFPDWRVQILEIIAEGNSACARWIGKVTHEGIFQGIPPTGKQISVSGINCYLVGDGKILQEWEQMDSLGMLQQLGVLPSPK